jgi:hypothetical protein
MSERDTMHHLDLIDALSHIVPASPAVVCGGEHTALAPRKDRLDGDAHPSPP